MTVRGEEDNPISPDAAVRAKGIENTSGGTTHYAHILSERPEIGFFEILTENYLDTGGRPLHILDLIAERYPVVMHGVSLSIGSSAA